MCFFHSQFIPICGCANEKHCFSSKVCTYLLDAGTFDRGLENKDDTGELVSVALKQKNRIGNENWYEMLTISYNFFPLRERITFRNTQ